MTSGLTQVETALILLGISREEWLGVVQKRHLQRVPDEGEDLAALIAAVEDTRGALYHQVFRNHAYNPDGCSACERAKSELGDRHAPALAKEVRATTIASLETQVAVLREALDDAVRELELIPEERRGGDQNDAIRNGVAALTAKDGTE